MHFPQLSLPLWLRHAALLGAGTLALVGCNPDDDTPEVTPEVKTNSVFVVNEGAFLTPNGTISLFDVESKTVTAVDIYKSANGGQDLLADVTQNMVIANGRGYIVANNNSKLEIVTLPDFKHAATISSPLRQPRYVVVASADKAYVTEWIQSPYPTPIAGRVAVIDLRTNTVTRTIPVGKAPEEMLLTGGKLFVANSEENTVTVINTSTDAVETTLTVGAKPSSFAQDRDGRVWVLGNGSGASVRGSLSDFTATAPYTVRKRDFAFTPGYGARLRRNNTGDQLYLRGNGAVYRIGIGEATLPTTPFIRRDFYGLDVDPNDGTIYTGVALSYSGPGRMVRYQPNGTALDSAMVGILPNGFAFYTK